MQRVYQQLTTVLSSCLSCGSRSKLVLFFFLGPECPSGGGISASTGGGSWGLPRANFEQMKQDGTILGANKAY